MINKLVPKCEPIFAADNLRLNAQKTEYLTVTKQDSSWRSVKLLGWLLGSEEDIKARISAANRAFSSIPWQCQCLTSRSCMFTVLIIPVLLYNCALWALSRKLSESLDVWQRRKLRFLLGVTYPHRISNNNLYKQSNQVPISSICRRRRLLWLGHVIREGPGAASYKALQLAFNIDDIKRSRGRPLRRWIDNINDDLKLLNISVACNLRTCAVCRLREVSRLHGTYPSKVALTWLMTRLAG